MKLGPYLKMPIIFLPIANVLAKKNIGNFNKNLIKNTI
jgi:hypothetical protein